MSVTQLTRHCARAYRSSLITQHITLVQRYASSSRDSARAAAAAAAAREVSKQRRSVDEEVEQKMRTKDDEEYKKRYKTAARKWVSSIIALPILFVTSYYLFDRLALGNQPKKWERNRELVTLTEGDNEKRD